MIRRRRIPFLACFLLATAGVAAWLYRSFIFHDDLMLWGQEMVDQSWALRKFGVDELKAGRGLPLWNPFVYGGVPYVAILPGPVFYPTSLLYLLMPLYRAIGWTFVLHTWLASGLAYFAGRAFGLRRWAAVVTGVAFMLTGMLTSMNEAGHDGRMFTFAFIPLIFGMLECGLRYRHIVWFLGMGLGVACQIFTPHIQSMYFSSLALSLYALVRVIWIWREDAAAARRVAGMFVIGFVVAALIGAAQLYPTFELVRIAVRGGGETGYEFAASYALPPQELTALFLPDLIGSLGTYWGSNPFKQHTEYVGAVTLLLGIIGATTALRDRRVALVLAVVVLGILYSLGAATPIHRIAYEVVPMIKNFRAASLMMGPVAFFIALLAGVGWQRVLDARERIDNEPGAERTERESGIGTEAISWTWILGLSAPFLLLASAVGLSPDGLVRWVHTSWYPVGWPRPTPEALELMRTSGWLFLGFWFGALAVAYCVARGLLTARATFAVLLLLALDLGRVGDRYIRAVDPAEVFSSDSLVTAVRSNMDMTARVFTVDGYGPNELMLYDIRSVTGLQNFRLEWTDRLMGGATLRNLRWPSLWPAFDIDYVITSQEIQSPLLQAEVASSRATAYRVVQNGPHAWFPRSVELAADSATALRRILQRPEIQAFALVAGDGPGATSPGAVPTPGEGSARIQRFLPNEVVLDVRASRGGLLVLSEPWHPNWHATIDGEPAPVIRTDIAFRGVEVPAGHHELRFTYSDRSVRVGLMLGGFTLVVCVGVIAVFWRQGLMGQWKENPAGD